MRFEQQVREGVEDILEYRKTPEDITGSTSVRCAIGIVIGVMEGITTLSESDAWDYLDRCNADLTQDLYLEYVKRTGEWRRQIYAMKAAEEEAEALACKKRLEEARIASEVRNAASKAFWAGV